MKVVRNTGSYVEIDDILINDEPHTVSVINPDAPGTGSCCRIVIDERLCIEINKQDDDLLISFGRSSDAPDCELIDVRWAHDLPPGVELVKNPAEDPDDDIDTDVTIKIIYSDRQGFVSFWEIGDSLHQCEIDGIRRMQAFLERCGVPTSYDLRGIAVNALNHLIDSTVTCNKIMERTGTDQKDSGWNGRVVPQIIFNGLSRDAVESATQWLDASSYRE